jgi:hypothetical protein
MQELLIKEFGSENSTQDSTAAQGFKSYAGQTLTSTRLEARTGSTQQRAR